jgi:hypothetical protein
MAIDIHPLTPRRWRDLETLFRTNSVTRGCWCMWFRIAGPEFRENSGDGNRGAFQRVVRRAEQPPGLLAYIDGAPVGWCAVAPRQEYPRLQRSPVTKAVDDQPVWSITCFFVAMTGRGTGVTRTLLREAVAFAARHGAKIVEGYPVDPAEGRITDDAAYHGLASTFFAAGFREVARRTPTRPVMRHHIKRR